MITYFSFSKKPKNSENVKINVVIKMVDYNSIKVKLINELLKHEVFSRDHKFVLQQFFKVNNGVCWGRLSHNSHTQ